MRLHARSAVVACALMAACTPTPFIVLQYPDTAAEAEAAELTVYALSAATDCGPILASGKLDAWNSSVTAKLPLDEPAHLGKLARGPAVFYAEIRDAQGRPYLRACESGSSGGEVVLVMTRVNRAPVFSAPGTTLTAREGEALAVDVVAADPEGTALTYAASGLPPFARFDAATHRLTVLATATDQGTYTFELSVTEDRAGGVTVTQSETLSVEDVPRPVRWDRLWRGWHGRFDAAALWDPQYRQLVVTGGRDNGIDLSMSSKTLYSVSSAQDALADHRILAFPPDGGPGDWRPNTVVRSSTSAKYGHVMGWVTTQGVLHARKAFIIGGSDGSQVTAETLFLDLGPRISYVDSATALLDPSGAAFHTGMASAYEPDYSKTYLFGGDLNFTSFTADLVEITAPEDTQIQVTKLQTSLIPRPPSRARAAMVLALNPKRIVVIGGQKGDQVSDLFGDAWILCLEELMPKCPTGSRNQWTRVINTGDTFPGSGSPGVFALAAGYDPANDRVVTYGGLGVVGNQSWLFEDAFALELGPSLPAGDGGVLAAFRHLPAPGGPFGLVGAASAYDPDAGRLLLYGGLTGRLVNSTPQLDMTDDVWSFGLAPGNEKLTKLPVVGEPVVPSRRLAGSIVREGPLMIAGQGEGFEPTDSWVIRPDGGATAVATSGISPLPRANMGVVYNNDLDEYWMYGGRVGTLLPGPAMFRYKLDAGFSMHAQPEVDSRFSQSNVYDEKNHRMIVFGGISVNTVGSSASVNDTLDLRIQNDTLVTARLQPAGPPTPRYGSIAGYDGFGQRMLLYGGTATILTADIDVNDVWELSLVSGAERWRQITPTGVERPEALYFPAGGWTKENPPKLYLVGTVKRPMAGGQYAFVDELWKLTIDPGNEKWTKLMNPDFRPRPRVFPAFTYDPITHRLYLSGGASDPVFRNDFWALTLP